MEALSALDPALTGSFRRPDANAVRPAPERPRAAKEHADIETGLRYTRSDRTSLYVQTQEGDIVRLRIKSTQSLTAKTSQSEDGDRVVAETSVRARSTTRLSLSVKGDLNNDELTALRTVFEQLGALAERFFSGGLLGVLAQADTLQMDPEQLATVALKLRSSTRLTYTGSPPAPVPTTALPPQAAKEPAPAADPADSAPVVVDADPTSAPKDVPAPAAEDAVAPPEAAQAPPDGALFLFRAILDFLTQLIDELERVEAPAAPSSDGASPSIDVSLKLKLFASIVVTLSETAVPDASDAASPEVDLLPAVIDSIVDQSEHLDALA